jgi:hypothetical protein
MLARECQQHLVRALVDLLPCGEGGIGAEYLGDALGGGLAHRGRRGSGQPLQLRGQRVAHLLPDARALIEPVQQDVGQRFADRLVA